MKKSTIQYRQYSVETLRHVKGMLHKQIMRLCVLPQTLEVRQDLGMARNRLKKLEAWTAKLSA